MNVFYNLVISLVLATANTVPLNISRRILRGNVVGDTRPYMVYLRPKTLDTEKSMEERDWLCGGAIIHAQYILTSAACIADVQNFYVISGTHRWSPMGEDSECIKNGAKRAVWKCVPKDYVFDGNMYENIRWMINDIAVVKVEDDFNFEKRVRGCDFIPQMIAYNNKSYELESVGTEGSVAGWGSTYSFLKPPERAFGNSPDLMETDVILMSKKNCKKDWPERYHQIIDEHMICGKDGLNTDSMSEICREREVDCKELRHSNEDDAVLRRSLLEANVLEVHSANHRNARRTKTSGGFCQNDHGGPLVVGHGAGATVVGIISACMTTNITQRCYGPFLYTSVWKNRNVINCAIEKEASVACKRLLRSEQTILSKTTFDWIKPFHFRGGLAMVDESREIDTIKPPIILTKALS